MLFNAFQCFSMLFNDLSMIFNDLSRFFNDFQLGSCSRGSTWQVRLSLSPKATGGGPVGGGGGAPEVGRGRLAHGAG